MNPPAQPPSDSDDEIEARAAAWLVEEEAGLNPEQAASFQQWLEADPLHRQATQRLRATWGSLQFLRDYRPGSRLHPDPDLLAPPIKRWKPSFAFATCAAAAAIVLAVVLVRYPEALPELPWNSTLHYVTDTGDYNRVLLPDGSVMEMNARTEVRVKFTRRERQVRLLRGEGYFVVAKEAARPFVVEANGLQVRAVGTEFNVRTEDRAVDVLVTHGRVKLASTQAVDMPEAPTLDAGQRVLIPDPKKLNARLENLPIKNVSADDERATLAWQNSRLHFVDATLANVVQQFNQRSHIQIIIADPELAGISVGGSFRPENAEAFLRLLSSSGEIKIERPEHNRILLRRGDRP